jgi:hypothetical protein
MMTARAFASLSTLSTLSTLLALASAPGCGGRGAGLRDGGIDATVEAPSLSGLRAFEVTATLTTSNDGGIPVTLPPRNTFTLVLDVEAGHAIVGGKGTGAVVPVTTADGRTFQTAKVFAVGLPSGNGCLSLDAIYYESIEITVDGATLQGKATGNAAVSSGDVMPRGAFTATLVGAADTKPPSLIPGQGTAGATPFDFFSVLTSKPLPATAKARLVAGDGSTIDLLPRLSEGTPPLITAFKKPDVVLAPGEGYTVTVDGLVDFVGNSGATEPPLRLSTFKAAPVVPEDGFESAVGTTLGGATLIRSGPLAPLAGAASAYVGSAGSPLGGGASASTALNVRLTLQPGDTTLRFSYRVVSSVRDVAFGGGLRFGSVGHSPGSSILLSTALANTPEVWPGDVSVFLSPVGTAEVAIPSDAQGELLVSIAIHDSQCASPPAGNPPGGILIDDLRVE